MPSDREHAVVLGGSMGGLLAARVLSDHFDRVTIVERDKFPAPGENRRGVPQGRHAHLLLASGAEALEQLFPGFREEAVADGALTTDIGEIQFTIGGIEAATFPSGLMSLQVTRPRLEAQTRRRVISLPNVEVREACAVEGLQAPSDGARVTGIRVEPEGDAAAAQVDADLIVDATGRGSRSPRWLEELRLRGATGGARRHRPALHDPVLPPPAGTFRGGAPGAIIAITPRNPGSLHAGDGGGPLDRHDRLLLRRDAAHGRRRLARVRGVARRLVPHRAARRSRAIERTDSA